MVTPFSHSGTRGLAAGGVSAMGAGGDSKCNVAGGGPRGDPDVAETTEPGGATEGDGATTAGVGAVAGSGAGAAAEAAGVGSAGAAMAAAPNKENSAAIATAIALIDRFIMPLCMLIGYLDILICCYRVASPTAASFLFRKRTRPLAPCPR
jgi:hypothetical protein